MNKYPELCDALDRLAGEGLPKHLPAELVAELAEIWNRLKGSRETGMHFSKLSSLRVEQPKWSRPVLTFRIERHGGRMQGSSRAELHEWSVDLGKGSASVKTVGYRQLTPNSPRMNTEALAKEAVEAILNGRDTHYLKWAGDRRAVRLIVGELIPVTVKQTTAARRRRFRASFERLLSSAGWTRTGLTSSPRPRIDLEETRSPPGIADHAFPSGGESSPGVKKQRSIGRGPRAVRSPAVPTTPHDRTDTIGVETVAAG